ncbi:uncharacterized protein AB675_3021 [Cyphellophora attinorum]|uniref:Uncharacterized protein n=1 Tax=Cyphellophora attinorum TaxID=1664694 RepID=A0A0N1NX55_9EURO|nr:uncharacterized protein AB675_3021 [Phialophora attinorum]KPI37952.1 hypothetical protein AB675_3021 [Phialophora attinorum]
MAAPHSAILDLAAWARLDESMDILTDCANYANYAQFILGLQGLASVAADDGPISPIIQRKVMDELILAAFRGLIWFTSPSYNPIPVDEDSRAGSSAAGIGRTIMMDQLLNEVGDRKAVLELLSKSEEIVAAYLEERDGVLPKDREAKASSSVDDGNGTSAMAKYEKWKEDQNKVLVTDDESRPGIGPKGLVAQRQDMDTTDRVINFVGCLSPLIVVLVALAIVGFLILRAA